MAAISEEDFMGLPKAEGVPVPRGKKAIDEASFMGLPPAEPAGASLVKGVTEFGKNATQVADLILGLPAFAAQVGVAGAASGLLAAMGSKAPLKEGSALVEEAMKAPWMKALSSPLSYMLGATDKDYKDTTVGKLLEKQTSAVQTAADYWS
jgi:hypothetical protein